MVKNLIILILLLQSAVTFPVVYTYTAFMFSNASSLPAPTTKMYSCRNDGLYKSCLFSGHTDFLSTYQYVLNLVISGERNAVISGPQRQQEVEIVDKSTYRMQEECPTENKTTTLGWLKQVLMSLFAGALL